MRRVKKEIILIDLLDMISVKKLLSSSSTHKNISTTVCTVEDYYLGPIKIVASYWSNKKKEEIPYSVSFNIVDSKTEITVIDDEVITVEDKTFSSNIFKSYISEEMKEKIRSIASKMQNT